MIKYKDGGTEAPPSFAYLHRNIELICNPFFLLWELPI